MKGDTDLNIAYCDNELSCLNSFLTDFSDIFADDTLRLFSTPDELLSLDPLPEIIFMDIELDQDLTGVDYAEKINERSPETKIIFITAYTEKYIQDAYIKNINIKGVIPKPVKREYLEGILAKARTAVTSEKKQKVLLDLGSSSEVVLSHSIIYAESNKHNTIVHTDDKDYTLRARLTDFADSLPSNFRVCHKSYAVNMDRIINVNRNSVILDTGKTIPISRSRSQEFRDIYFDYISTEDK